MKSFFARPMIAMLCAAVLAIFALSVQAPPFAQAASPASAQICVSTSHTGGSMTTLTQKSFTISCPGVAVGSFVDVAGPSDLLLLTVTGYVSAAGTVTVLIVNGSSGSITDPTGVYRAKVTGAFTG